MRDIIEKAVSMAFNVLTTLTYSATYVVISKQGFTVDDSETYPLQVIIVDDETDDPSYESSNLAKLHDLKIIFETSKLPVKSKHGDKIILEEDTFEIKDPIQYDPIKATTTLALNKIS